MTEQHHTGNDSAAEGAERDFASDPHVRRGSDETHDSGGTEWHGRALTSTGFDDDRGEADETLLAAARAARAEPGSESDRRLVAALEQARLLVPVVAVPGETETVDRDGKTLVVDSGADMATVTVTSPEGERGLPVFSSIAALAAWNAEARPVPVTSDRACQAAVSEQCSVLLLDLGSEDFVLVRPSMVWALAQRQQWLPAHEDEQVASAVERAVRDEEDVLGHVLDDGGPEAAGTGTLRVTLGLREGLAPQQVGALAQRVGERIATDGEVRARIDALAFRITAAG